MNSTLVAALISPPTFSMSSAICRAERRRRALERHVLDEVREAVLVGALVARARSDPDAERRGRDVRHRLGGDGEAVGEARDVGSADRRSREMPVHAAAPRMARARSRMKLSTAAWSFGSTVKRSRAGPSGRRDAAAGRDAAPSRRSTASGNLAGCAVASATTGVAGSLGEERARRPDADGACGDRAP